MLSVVLGTPGRAVIGRYMEELSFEEIEHPVIGVPSRLLASTISSEDRVQFGRTPRPRGGRRLSPAAARGDPGARARRLVVAARAGHGRSLGRRARPGRFGSRPRGRSAHEAHVQGAARRAEHSARCSAHRLETPNCPSELEDASPRSGAALLVRKNELARRSAARTIWRRQLVDDLPSCGLHVRQTV